MFVARNLQKHCRRTLISQFLTNAPKNGDLFGGFSTNFVPRYVICSGFERNDSSVSSIRFWNCFEGCRVMSTARGRSMRSKVELRMKKESGKTLREIRRAKKIQKKLMTDEERLIYNLRRAKKKVALLLQKLKKYELPDLPPPLHDPEILTPEQVQAYKKIGFRCKNYVAVGVRGVFGGVVQNMHMHWKFHETVQVCCDNFPKEKIKGMAIMLARLSGGIVVNIHNVKTIIMYRGRNYRQPKNLIPLNTLTKRKALFKARFEQALESQKLNIKKVEQELRKKNVNPEDPVAMASIQRVASTFFNAIDKKQGTPYVYHGDKPEVDSDSNLKQPESDEDSDQEELDKFIAEIEDAANREWAAEEEAQKEEANIIRYWNKEDFDGRFRRPEMGGRDRERIPDSDDEDVIINNEDDESDDESDDEPDEAPYKFESPKVERWRGDKSSKRNNSGGFKGKSVGNFWEKIVEENSESEDMLGDLENVMFESDEEKGTGFRRPGIEYQGSSSDEEGGYRNKVLKYAGDGPAKVSATKDSSSDPEIALWESEAEEEPESRRVEAVRYNYDEDEDYDRNENLNSAVDDRKMKTSKQLDENWDSD